MPCCLLNRLTSSSFGSLVIAVTSPEGVNIISSRPICAITMLIYFSLSGLSIYRPYQTVCHRQSALLKLFGVSLRMMTLSAATRFRRWYPRHVSAPRKIVLTHTTSPCCQLNRRWGVRRSPVTIDISAIRRIAISILLYQLIIRVLDTLITNAR